MTTATTPPVPEGHISATLRALKRNEFVAFYVPTGGEAVDLVLQSLPRHATSVGVGGSATLREIGLVDAVRARGFRVLDHWDPSLGFQETVDLRRAHLTCDVFLSSVNAVTQSGELVSRDGIGNRVCASTFGPGKVFLVAGVQKIVPDLGAAFERIRQIAAPMRARSLGLDLPCRTETGCTDCSSPVRICRATLVLHRRPLFTDTTVILVGEPLGS